MPTVLEGAFVNNGGTANVYSNAFCGYLSLGAGGGTAGSGSIYLSGNLSTYANASGNEFVGDSGIGYIEQWSGTNNAVTAMYIGNSTNATGSYSLNGGVVATPYLYMGYNGHASFVQNAGVVTVANEMDMFSNNYNVSYNLSGGSLAVPVEHIGDRWTASFTQSGGTHSVSNYIYLGGPTNGTGIYNLSGNGLFTTPTLVVGNNPGGTGIFTQNGGTASVTSTLYLGYLSTASGSCNLSGGALAAPAEFVGYYGNGSFTQSGGVNSAPSYMYVAYLASSAGSYSMSGGSVATPYQYIGAYGNGTFTQNGGTNSVSQELDLGAGTGSHGSYSLSGSGLLNVYALTVGGLATGTFMQSGGTAKSSYQLTLGAYGASASGSYNLNGGLLSIAGLAQGPGAAAFYFSGGTLQAGAGFSTSLPIQLTGGGTFDTNGFAMTLNGALSGPGGFQEVGGGTLTVTAANTFQGSVAVNSGILQLPSGLLPAYQEFVGLTGGTASVVQTGGTNAVSLGLSLGYNGNVLFTPGGAGFYTLKNGLLSTGDEYIGSSGTGSFVQSGGTNTTNYLELVGYYGTNPTGTYNLNGGLLRVYSSLDVSPGSADAFVFSGGTFQAGTSFTTSAAMQLNGASTFDTSGNSLTLAGVLSGSGGLTKIGAGTLVLSGTDTYAGGTIVKAGTLRIVSRYALLDGSALGVGNDLSAFGAIDAANIATPATPVPEPGTLTLFAAAAGITLFAGYRWRG